MTIPATTDVAIVGAGAAGCFLAAELAEAGLGVTVFDAGPAWHRSDMVSSQIWARRLRWGGAHVESAGTHPFAFNFNAGWGIGGTALHHYGTWPRLQETDFNVKSTTGRGLDWPLDYDDLMPFYDAIQKRAGVSGDAGLEPWRAPGAPYPLPPLATTPQATAIARGFSAEGIAVAPAPMAILSQPYQGRPGCLYDGWCDAGCPIDALYHPLAVDHPRAIGAGARFEAGATVTRVHADAKRATGMTVVDSAGTTHRISAGMVVLAGSVVGNPTLLLNSANTAHPNGLANSSGLVGSYFMSHAVCGVYGLFDDQTRPHLGVSGAQLLSQADYEKNRGEGPFGSYQWLAAAAMKPNDLLGIATARVELFGADLDKFMRRAVNHIGNMVTFAEEMPRKRNRIELSETKDALGCRKARIVHEFDANTLALVELAKAQGLRILEAAGAHDRWAGGVNQAHMMGGTIMGEDATASITDSYGRTHDLPNLIIAGSGLFPTSGASNPTFTLYALAARTAAELISSAT